MRKSALVLAAVVLAAGVHSAQARVIEKGSFELSGDTTLGYNSTTLDVGGDDVDSDVWTVSTALYYYFFDQIGLGLALDYESQDLSFGGESVDAEAWSFGPKGRYHFDVNPALNVYVGAGAAWLQEEVEGTELDGWAVSAEAGLAMFPLDRFAVNFGLSYSLGEVEDDDGTDADVDSLDARVGLSVFF